MSIHTQPPLLEDGEPFSYDQRVATQFGHSMALSAMAWTPDSRLLATMSSDEIKLWNVSTGQEVRTFTAVARFCSMSVSSKGLFLAAGTADGLILVWDIASGDEYAILRGHQGRVSALSFGPDDTLLASASLDNTIRLWNVDMRRSVAIESLTSDAVNLLAFNADGRVIASLHQSRNIVLWDVNVGIRKSRSRQFTHEIACMRFSSDGSLLMLASEDAEITLWEVDSDHLRTVRLGSSAGVMDVSADGKLVAASTGQDILVQQLGHEQELLQRIAVPFMTSALRYSPNLTMVAVGSSEGDIRIVDVVSGKKIWAFGMSGERINSLEFLLSDEVLSVGSSGGTLRIRRVVDGRLLQALTDSAQSLRKMATSEDGRIAAWLTGTGSVRVWNLNDGKEVLLDSKQIPAVTDFELFSDGRAIVLAFESGIIKVYEIRSGRCFRTLSTGHSHIHTLHYCSKLNTLFLSSRGRITCIDLVTGKSLWNLMDDELLAVTDISADGTLLACVTRDYRISMRNASNGEEMDIFQLDDHYFVEAKFDPAGEYLAARDGERGGVLLFDVASGRMDKRFATLEQVTAMTFSRTGTMLATGSSQGVVKIWNLQSGTDDAVMLAFDRGNWLSILGSNRLFRGDDGTLVGHTTPDGKWNSLKPPIDQDGSILSATILQTLPIVLDRDAPGTMGLVVRIWNTGTAPSIWVRLETGVFDLTETCAQVSSPPPLWLVIAGERAISRLEPGASIDIPVWLSYRPRQYYHNATETIGPKSSYDRGMECVVNVALRSLSKVPVEVPIKLQVRER